MKKVGEYKNKAVWLEKLDDTLWKIKICGIGNDKKWDKKWKKWGFQIQCNSYRLGYNWWKSYKNVIFCSTNFEKVIEKLKELQSKNIIEYNQNTPKEMLVESL